MVSIEVHKTQISHYRLYGSGVKCVSDTRFPPPAKAGLVLPWPQWSVAAYVGLRHARMNVSAGLRHAYASLSFPSLALCCKKPTKYYLQILPLCTVGSSTISKPSCHLAENFREKKLER